MTPPSQPLNYRNDIGLTVQQFGGGIRVTAPPYGFARSAERNVRSLRFWAKMAFFCFVVGIGWRATYRFVDTIIVSGTIPAISPADLIGFFGGAAIVLIFYLGSSAGNGVELTLYSDRLTVERRKMFLRRSSTYMLQSIRGVSVNHHGVWIKLTPKRSFSFSTQNRVIMSGRTDAEHQRVATLIDDWLKNADSVIRWNSGQAPNQPSGR